METLLTILARRNSKGLPGKNVKPMLGVPLCEWSMRQAEAWAVERDEGGAVIVVSSDDPEVKKLALKHGLWFIHRPPELATDESGKVSAIRHAWRWAEREAHRVFDMVIDLDVCNPLRRLEDIEAVYEKMCSDPTALTIFSVTRARRSPFFNMWPPVMGTSLMRRQDAPEMWDLNCNVYAYSREFMLSDRQNVLTDRTMIYEMPDWTFCDIDTELDFWLVEKLMEKYG